MHMCVSVGGCVHISVGVCGGQRHQILLKLELQVDVSYLLWELGAEF